MTRDRLIQFLALLIGLSAWIGATSLIPTINQQRRVGGLTFDLNVGDQAPPKYVIATVMLGSFRGLAVDVLWYRAEHLKNEGKLNEANSLAHWITTLQPRFPQVWSFQAWNMAYNISVQTHTPQERWDWVNKGIRLLREEGIVYNPNATRLYRELGWIFFHKIGKYSDDMHWYYKQRLALEWQLVLGAQIQGATTAQVIEGFRPIAQAADSYFVFNRLSIQAKALLRKLADDDEIIAQSLLAEADLNLVRFEEALTKLEQESARDDPQRAKKLQPLRKLIEEHTERSTHDVMSLYYADKPAARPLVEMLHKADLELDGQTLKQIGRLMTVLRFGGMLYADEPRFVRWVNTNFRGIDQKILLQHEAIEDNLLPFLRAKVLVAEYHMDPGVMLELMELFGPLDWRHPATHGIYWSFLGVRRAGELVDSTRIDLLNTDRQVIHGLQELMFFGKVSYDPRLDRIDLLPDPRFIDSYFVAMDRSLERIGDADIRQKSGTGDEFESGHENFLQRAVLYTYLYGDTAQAQRHYQTVRDLYGTKEHNLRSGRYLLTLDDFIMRELTADGDSQAVSRQFIDGMIFRGMTQGLGNGRRDVFEKFITLAKKAHERYQQSKISTATATRDRLRMLPFEETLVTTYAATMRNQRLDFLLRSKIYAYTPMSLREKTYPIFRSSIMEQAQQLRMHPAAAFPPPPGFSDEQIVKPPEPEEPTTTIQRQ